MDCKKYDNISLVDIDKIPKEVIDTPTDNLMDVFRVCTKMQTLCEKEHGIGLAAVQVGIPWRLFILKADEYSPFDMPGQYGYYINCDYIFKLENYILSLEGCLSVRSPSGQLRFFQVQRFETIILNGLKLKVGLDLELQILKDVEIDARHQGVVFQHEISHNRGELISDVGKEVFLWR